MHIYTGEPAKAIAYIERAMRLDPDPDLLNGQYVHFLGTAHFVAGKYETAATCFKDRITINPTTDLSRALLASALGHLGRHEEARQVWHELKEINPRYSYADHFARLPFKNPTDADKLTDGLLGRVTARSLGFCILEYRVGRPLVAPSAVTLPLRGLRREGIYGLIRFLQKTVASPRSQAEHERDIADRSSKMMSMKGNIRMSSKLRFDACCAGAAIAIGAAMLVAGRADTAELNAAAVIYKLPDQIDWKGTGGNRSAVLAGDPEKPGLYIVINKWLAGNHFSRPHLHPNDRFITVLKGTWWVGTGNKFNPDDTVPMPAGTFVTHFGKQVHWDGAKDEDAVLLIVGEGPATSTRVEEAK